MMHLFMGMPAVIASETMYRLMASADRAARSQATILITGESGAGKELVARAIHQYSARSSKAWVDLSCAALPENLLESELFGYDRGAFSGADSAKPGLFELAHQGTIFLDEIGELDLRMQVKLLRVLDGTPYFRLGGVKKVSVDVRVVAATNRNLEEAVAEGRFRNDLYHRLSQITLRVPPLRERVEDIAPLARYFLAHHGAQFHFSEGAFAALEAYDWPGNIRELRNVVTKAAVLARSEKIRAEDLQGVPQIGSPARSTHSPTHSLVALAGSVGSAFRPSGHRARDEESSGRLEEFPAGAPGASLQGMEKRMILDALAATGGHQQKAADRLGISRRTLSRKLKAYESERVRTAV